MNKQLEIFNSVLDTAQSVLSDIKKMPKTGKHKRNIFIKTYNRRPGNKHKRAAVMACAAMDAVMGAVQIATIMSQPIPKFHKDELRSTPT